MLHAIVTGWNKLPTMSSWRQRTVRGRRAGRASSEVQVLQSEAPGSEPRCGSTLSWASLG